MYGDKQILEQLKQGRGSKAYEKALSYIYRQYYEVITKRLRAGWFSLELADAEEKYLEALTIFEQKVLAGADIPSIEAYLWGIARNKARQWLRNEERRKKHLRIVGSQVESATTQPDENLTTDDCQQFYHEKIRPLLGERCSDLLLLKSLGYQALEIAEKLDYTSKNKGTVVRVSLHKCWKKLAGIVEKHPPLQRQLQALFA